MIYKILVKKISDLTRIYHLRYIVDFRSAVGVAYDHRSVASTLLGAKDGGHHHPKRTSALTSLRRQIRCCALATTITWFYELIDRQLAAETVAQAQRRLVRRKLVNTTARSWRCRPPSLAPNSVLVSRSARSPSSLGAIGEKNTRDPILVKSQRVNEFNESTI